MTASLPKMNPFGISTIHPLLFYPAKVLGLINVILMLLSLGGIHLLVPADVFYGVAVAFLTVGLITGAVSLLNLGKSTRMGLPAEKTSFKKSGLYRFSRNPMYLGLNMAIMASVLYFLHPVVIVAGLFSIVVHHFIIQGEERFLEKRFGEEYRKYRASTRRYF
jgi:protein-S-isoprenylcysteine O-methyltransferase Ste14